MIWQEVVVNPLIMEMLRQAGLVKTIAGVPIVVSELCPPNKIYVLSEKSMIEEFVVKDDTTP
jgi:hypothetical protein